METRNLVTMVVSKSYKNLVVFTYFLFKLAEVDRVLPIAWWLVIEGLCIFVMYKRAKNIYRSFKLMNFGLLYEY